MSFGFERVLRRGLIPALAVAALLLAGCGGSGSGSSGSSSSDAPPKKGGTLRVTLGVEPNTLEPADGINLPEIQIDYQVIETLFRPGKNEEAEPWLVENFKKSADLRNWTLHLRPEVKFSTGKPMTADDVVFSIETIKKSEIWGNLFEEITAVKAVDPLTVQIKTNAPAPALPDTLTLFAAGVIPENYGGVSEDEFGKHPIGTGPFELAAWKRGSSLTLKRNPLYWQQDRPYLDEIVFLPVPEDNSRVSQLKGEELDVIAEPPWSQVSALEGTPGLTVASHDQVFTGSVIVNDKYPLFKDPRAREAVNLALNRDDIAQAAMSGNGEPAASWFPGFVLYAKDIPPPAQDVAKAKQLLAEAVKDTGESPKVTLTYTSGESYYMNFAQVAQQNLEEAGFEISLKPLEGGAFEEFVFGGEYQMSLIKVLTLMYDPIEFAAFYPGTSGLFTFSDTSKVNDLVLAAAEEVDPEKRRRLYYEIQELIAAEKYVITANDVPTVYALQDDVTGFTVPGTGYIRYADVAFAE